MRLRRVWDISVFSGLALVTIVLSLEYMQFQSYSFAVAVIAGTLLPNLTKRDQRLLAHDGDEEDDAELTRLRDTVREWRADAAMKGKPLKLPRMPFMLRNIWTAAMLLFTILTFLTFFVKTVVQAIIVVSLIGICWAVACWVPFAMIMEVSLIIPYT